MEKTGSEFFWRHFFIWKITMLSLAIFPVKLSAEISATPSALSPGDAERLVNKLPSYTAFGYSGLAFYGKNLYASSGIGLMEFAGGSLKYLYQWNKFDADAEGPWVNLADKQLWVWLAGNDLLAGFDGKSWRVLPIPQPKKGYVSRGDILEGYHGVSNTNTFWLTGGGSAWPWDSINQKWKDSLALPSFKSGTRSGSLQRLFLLGNEPFVVARYEPGWAILGRDHDKNLTGDTIHYFEDSWKDVTNNCGGLFFAEQVVTVEGKGYIRTVDGELLEVTKDAIVQLRTLGKCEVLATTSSGTLLACFHNVGVYEFKKDWELRFKTPYPANEGEHWVHLAEGDGQIALSVSPVPQLVAGKNISDYKTVYNSSAALWIFDGQKLENILFPNNKLHETHP